MGESSEPLDIAIVHPKHVAFDTMYKEIKRCGKYNCVAVDPSKKPYKNFSIKTLGIYILKCDSKLDPAREYDPRTDPPILQGAETRSLFIIPHTQKDLELAIKSGADGCVSEEEGLDNLYEGIHNLFSGETYCSPSLNPLLFNISSRNLVGSSYKENEYNLSPRELEIAKLIRRNFSNKEVAKELHLSPFTVKNHVHNLLEKLCVASRYDIGERLVGI